MIPELPLIVEPRWLTDIGEAPQNGLTIPLPLRAVLEDSLFYPASEFDGTPVKLLAGNVLSFVYAGYGFIEGEIFNENFFDKLMKGFLGYSLFAGRNVDRSEIVPEEWAPSVKPADTHRCHDWESRAFAHWSIWKRDDDREESHGPLLFSLLFLGWEALAAYEATYLNKTVSPKIIALILPGGGWTSLRSDDGLFKWMVRTNRAGMPGYLLCDRSIKPPQRPYWSDYNGQWLREFPEQNPALWPLNVNVFFFDLADGFKQFVELATGYTRPPPPDYPLPE